MTDKDPLTTAKLWVEGADRALKNGDDMPDIQGWYHVLKALLGRLTRFEKNMPSWAHGTPEDYDAWLRDLTPDDRRLGFYQWIGAMAVSEAVEMLRRQIGEDPIPVQHQHYDADMVNDFLDAVDPRQPLTDPFPAQLPVGRVFCDVSHHSHPHGGGRLPTCRLDSGE